MYYIFLMLYNIWDLNGQEFEIKFLENYRGLYFHYHYMI